jgi:PKD repeat protein
MRISLIVLFCIWGISTLNGQVTIGSNNPPDPSAVLDIQSTSGGFALPRMTTAQRNNIANPVLGLQIFNLTTQCVETHFNGGWRATACECTTAPATPSAVSGPADFCVNQSGLTYSVTPQADASSYTWSIPPGATLVSGQGSNAIVLNLGSQSGVVSVTASNSCGTTSASSLTVNPSVPSAAFTPLAGSINNAVTFAGPAGMSSYAWTFAGGTPATASTQNPQITWTNAGTYAVTLTVTNSVGCSTTLTQSVVISLCQPLTRSFSTCGATGRFGPSQSQCNTAYGLGVVTVNGGKQTWTVPETATYRIEAAGAQGGGTSGGQGAIIRGDFTLTAGQNIEMIVGQRGNTNGSGGGCGGGGGSFVYNLSQASLLIAAGGGGGMDCYNSGGIAGHPGTASQTNATSNATPGAGGLFGVQNGSSGGAGWNQNGATDSWSTGGERFLTTGNGGTGYAGAANNVWSGGFGGGGGSTHSGGGGGGYTGGHPGRYMSSSHNSPGGGAGSFNGGTNQNNQNGANAAAGSITITKICP